MSPFVFKRTPECDACEALDVIVPYIGLKILPWLTLRGHVEGSTLLKSLCTTYLHSRHVALSDRTPEQYEILKSMCKKEWQNIYAEASNVFDRCFRDLHDGLFGFLPSVL